MYAVSPLLSARIRHFLKRAVGLTLASLLTLTLVAYLADYAAFRYRVAANRQPFGQITVTSYDAVQQKNGRTEFLFNSPQTQTCVHSLFSHGGFEPCWYLQRHTEQRTDI